MTETLRVLHFNDVYRVTPQKTPTGKISVAQFAHLIHSKVESLEEKPLLLFSGDVFSPSVESTVTRGSHMVPVLNSFGLDAAVTGNHDFDFGYPHLTKLIKDSNYPWLLSNIYDKETGAVPAELKEFVVLESNATKIGVIGLVEEDWITTVSSWPPNFQYKDMAETADCLSKTLRDPQGQWCCDIIIALTHSRLPNDITLAKATYARPSSFEGVANHHGVDLILGGHDHLYFVSKGFQSWEGYDMQEATLGSEDDDGVLVVKSGTDFRDFSEIIIELQDAPAGAIRKKLLKSVQGKRHSTTPNTPASEEIEKLLSTLLTSVSSHLNSPLCNTTVPLDLRSELIRIGESVAGNWFADILFHCYDDALCLKGLGGADGVFLCAGALRGDSVYGPGSINLGDIMEILPFEDPIVVLEMTGATLWEALESALKPWPAQEGRFPVISGFRVTWDSSRPLGERVLDVAFERSNEESEPTLEAVPRDSKKEYKIITRDYMALGHDGYEAFNGSKFIIDEEHGVIMSTLVRSSLATTGSQFLHVLKQEKAERTYLNAETPATISRAREAWKKLGQHVLAGKREALRDAYTVSAREHMQSVDCFDGGKTRIGKAEVKHHDEGKKNNLIDIHPRIDGRLRNVGNVGKG